MPESHHQESHKKEANYSEYIKQLEDFLNLYLVKKAPALPKNWKEFIVKISPWLVIVGAVLAAWALIGLFTAMSNLNAAAPYAAAMSQITIGPQFYISIALSIAVIVLELLALPGLFARTKKGWNLVFYASLVSAVSSLISMNIGSLIIGTLLSLYILFQIREYYK